MKVVKNKEYYIDSLSHKKIRNWKDEITIKTAISLLEDIEDVELENVKTEDDLLLILLNGADSWEEYSKTGCFLIYDDDITAFQIRSAFLYGQRYIKK